MFESTGNHLGDLAGGIWTAVGVGAAWLARQYLVPLLQVEKRRRFAGWIAAIADDVTDDLRMRYPGEAWAAELDRAVDRLIEVCGIDREVAERAVHAAVTRRSQP